MLGMILTRLFDQVSKFKVRFKPFREFSLYHSYNDESGIPLYT